MLEILALGALGAAGLLYVAATTLIFNSCILWFVGNHMMNIEGGVTFVKCILTEIGLFFAIILGILCLLIPFVGLFLGLIVWWVVSKAMVESFFEMIDGGGTVVVLNLFMSFAVKYLIGFIMAA